MTRKSPTPTNSPQPAKAGVLARLVPGAEVALPAGVETSTVSLEACLKGRRSTRNYSGEPVTLQEVAQLLWAAQGVTGLGGLRTAPSPGAIYPMRLYVAAANVTSLRAGVYRFDADRNVLQNVCRGDKRAKMMLAAMGQECVYECALAVLVAANYGRMRREFGEQSTRLALLEAGHIAQNFLLEAMALGLGAIGLGRLDSDAMREALCVRDDEHPLYLLLTGHK